jgi:hypothetical protein
MTPSEVVNTEGATSTDATNRLGKRGKRIQTSIDVRQGRRTQTECENDLLKRLVADLVLEKALLTERLREYQAQE